MNMIDLSSSAGFTWRFKPEGGTWSDILVPAGGWKAQGFPDCDAGLYRCDIPLPAEAEGKNIRVRFDAVNFGAEVFAGPSIDKLKFIVSHTAGWMPFDADISRHCRAGETVVLAIRVKGRKKFLRNGKYLVPQGGTWQEGLADGILRGVSLILRPKVHVADVFVETSVTEDTIRVEPNIRNTSDQTVPIRVRTSFSPADPSREFAYPLLPEYAYEIGPGEELRLDGGRHGWGLGPESFWWPNVPYTPGYRTCLHVVKIDIISEEGIPLHTHSEKFGFREFKAAGAHYTLNGIRCNLRGDNQQEANFGTDAYGICPGFGPPSAGNEGWPQAVDNLQRVNFNVLRIHQIPATDYMLDVCDEMGLMIVAETPIRGSERKEDFVAGRPNMIAAVRELVRRDRRHPSVVLWSAANEIWGERNFALALIAAAQAEDSTRPVIIDGVEEMGPPIINMEHYVGGFGVVPEFGGTPRSDRPYGETESVWPMDNSLQGFCWISTATRIRRLKQNADIRNYVLNNCWPNYIPGQSPGLQFLEKKIKDIRWEKVTSGMEILPSIDDPWSHPLIRLMQRSFHPFAVIDPEYEELNKKSDADGRWPVAIPELKAGSAVIRKLAVFNDAFGGDSVTVEWEFRRSDGSAVSEGRFVLSIPCGEYRTRTVLFTAPEEAGEYVFFLRSLQNGSEKFSDDSLLFRVVRP